MTPEPAVEAVRGAPSARWLTRSLVIALGATLLVVVAQLMAFAIAGSSQAATGPATPDGSPARYFVFSPSPANPGLGSVLGNWDGEWYERIATAGYPSAESVTSANEAWVTAFPPGFPVVVGAVMRVTGLPFVWTALVLNIVLLLATVVLLYRLLTLYGLDERMAGGAAAGVSLLPSSPVLITAYSESLALLLVVSGLLLVLSRRYLWLSFVILCLGLTRPVAIAFAAVLVVHALRRVRAPADDRPTVTEWAGMGFAAGVALTTPWLWPRLSAYLYGVPDVIGNSGAERTEQIAAGLGSGYFLTALHFGGVGALVLLCLAVCLLIGVPALVGVRLGWPLELTAWGAAYLVMVVLATPVTPGFLRYLALAAPLLVTPVAALVSGRGLARYTVLAMLVALLLWGQWFWIRYIFILDPAPALVPWAP